VQDERSAAASFLAEHDVTYPSVFDEAGEVRDRLGFVGLPDTVFYRADGSIAATWSGPLTAPALDARLARITPAPDEASSASSLDAAPSSSAIREAA
jgi:hypothetical protein